MASIYALLFVLLLSIYRTEALKTLVVNITILETAMEKEAVYLDGSAPAFRFHSGTGSGVQNWLLHLEGGGWCSTVSECLNRTNEPIGSSKKMPLNGSFTGVLSNDPDMNPGYLERNFSGRVGLAAILNCDKFRYFLPIDARVKCICDAGFFINVNTIAGKPEIKELYERVVSLHPIAIAVGDWFYEGSGFQNTDCPYPCGQKFCH
ncbi:pectin acetylesterase 8-like [Nicotiana tabacum]|uniref:Pectin acetylesterase n=1 Tax=Nicotiana tabacum TaxID=4097 RepID=A0A1S4DN27_TOBAC|nr:PREDICTED: pectin acetylesterase 8-like [Nicotiana tabacum]